MRLYALAVTLVAMTSIVVGLTRAPACPGTTAPFLDADGNTVAGSYAGLERVVLNGIEQTILVRGRDTSKPVLLFLHGGPGMSFLPFVSLFHTGTLEENFIVVHWDQRGSGASYSNALTADDMRIDLVLDDALDLAEHLAARFGQEKIFLLGHSWGSALGFMAIAARPELFHAFVAAGEAVDWDVRQVQSYRWALDEARRRDAREAVDQLESLAPFDPSDLSHVAVKNEWVEIFGGEYHDPDLYRRYEEHVGQGVEYSTADLRRFQKGIVWSRETLESDVARSGYSLMRDLPEVEIPVVFFAGRFDQQTPSTLAKAYFDRLIAPHKEFLWFEDSAHYTIFAEPEKTADELVRIARETLARNMESGS